jgi:hypothetical protein
MRFVALATALLAAAPAIAVEDTARIGLREDGGKPLAAFPAPLAADHCDHAGTGHGARRPQHRDPARDRAQRQPGRDLSLFARERFVSERFGLKLTVTR